LLERAERRQDYQRADAIKRANPASWKHVNLYGAYSFLDIGDGVDLQELVNLLEAARGSQAIDSGSITGRLIRRAPRHRYAKQRAK
jgi:hypothetical protein